MNKLTEEKLACSLTAETTELIPFLPYLLQDLWVLGMNPFDMLKLIKKHMTISENTMFLELACGKGAGAVNIAKELNVKVCGFDLMPDFIEYAKQKAEEYGVQTLCKFDVGDVNEVVNIEKNYDCVILGAAGDILGSPSQTLQKLSQTIKPNGYIIMDATYLPDDKSVDNLKWDYEYIYRKDWLQLFAENGLKLIEELTESEQEEIIFETEIEAIAKRAGELIKKYPEESAIFEGYVKTQCDEVADLESVIEGTMWILRKCY